MNAVRGVCLMVFVLTLALQADAAEVAKPGGEQGVTSIAARPAYVPPLRGAPSGRVGGGTRGTAESRYMAIEVMAPDHLGMTSKNQPCLYWHIPGSTSLAVEFTVTEAAATSPLLEKKLPSPERGGIQSFCLAESGVSLIPDTPYKWFVALVPDADNRSRDILAGGMIQLSDAPASLRNKVRNAAPSDIVCAYAEEGFWYDSFAAVMETLKAAPGDETALMQRTALLEQVGLGGVME
jgi:hypothetical protein